MEKAAVTMAGNCDVMAMVMMMLHDAYDGYDTTSPFCFSTRVTETQLMDNTLAS